MDPEQLKSMLLSPYFELLQPLIQKARDAFTLLEGDVPCKFDTPYPLTMHYRSNEELKSHEYIYKFEIPIPVKKYLDIINDYELQKKLDPNIDEFRRMQHDIQSGIQLVYLSYKKFLFMMPRDFVYVRFSFKWDGQHWVISTSDRTQKEIAGKTRAFIVLTAMRMTEKQGNTQVEVYSHSDLKMNLKSDIAQKFMGGQIKKGIDQLFKALKTTVIAP